MTYISRRQLEAAGLPLGDSATRSKPGGGRILGGGGSAGGGHTTSTVTQQSIPDWLRPQTEAMLGSATQEYFQTQPTGDGGFNITGMRPYTPYSADPRDYVAGFSPLQQQTQFEAANMQRPGQFASATDLATAAGAGLMDSTGRAYAYGEKGSQYGDMGAQLGIAGGQRFGQMGAGYGQQAAGLAPEAQAYGREAADIGKMALEAQGYGREVGEQARDYSERLANKGRRYEQMAQDPEAMQSYMSPYMRNVMEQQKESAVRDAQKANLAQNLGSVRQGTYGGARQLLAETERERALQSQMANIEAAGTQKAYEDAQQAQQYGIDAGIRGLTAAQQGLGTALQGGQLGLSGIGQAIAGQQAGLSGLGQAGQLYGLGMQGAQVGLQGVDRQLAGTGQGMQGAQIGLQGVSTAQQGFNMAGGQAANLANIGSQQQQADLNRVQFQSGLGGQQQQQQQQIINQAIQNYGMAQQNPYQQLAGYNAILRGYQAPTTTVSQYAAAPSAASQIGGLGMAGAALYGMAGKKKGGRIREPRGGIDDLAVHNAMKKKVKR